MCGIAGFSLLPNAQVDATTLTGALALSIESRGRDATGVAWYSQTDRTLYCTKEAEPASAFIHTIFDQIEADTRHAIIHTRASTKGSPSDNNNNHPISLGGIVGVHNGMLTNDDEVAKKLELDRVGEVDSEVIFHVIRYHGGVNKVGELLEGDAAIAWMSYVNLEDRPPVQLAHLGGRTAVYSRIYLKDENSGALWDQGIIFASTETALKSAAKDADVELGTVVTLTKGKAVVFDDGELVSYRDVTDITRPTKYSNSYWNSAEGYYSSNYTPHQGSYKPKTNSSSSSSSSAPSTSFTSTVSKPDGNGTLVTRYHGDGTQTKYRINKDGTIVEGTGTRTDAEQDEAEAEAELIDFLRSIGFDNHEARFNKNSYKFDDGTCKGFVAKNMVYTNRSRWSVTLRLEGSIMVQQWNLTPSQAKDLLCVNAHLFFGDDEVMGTPEEENEDYGPAEEWINDIQTDLARDDLMEPEITRAELAICFDLLRRISPESKSEDWELEDWDHPSGASLWYNSLLYSWVVIKADGSWAACESWTEWETITDGEVDDEDVINAIVNELDRANKED